MKIDTQAMLIPLQVGTEVRITNSGEIIVNNPELELADNPEAADGVLAYHFDANKGQHILKLVDPVVVGRGR